MYKFLTFAVLGLTCVLANTNTTNNSSAPDMFADPYEQQKEVEKLVKKHMDLLAEKAALQTEKADKVKEIAKLDGEKTALEESLEKLKKAADKVKTDAAEFKKANKKVTAEQEKLDQAADAVTKAHAEKSELSGKIRDKNTEVTNAFIAQASAQHSVGSNPDVNEVLTLLTNGKGSLFKMAEVLEESDYEAWNLWHTNLVACQTNWNHLKTTDQAEADKNQTATVEIYTNRVKADDLSIKACSDFASFVKTNITDVWTEKAGNKSTAEVKLDTFPKAAWEAAEKQYIHDYLKAEYAQAKTLLALKKDDATVKPKLEQVIEEMKQYQDKASQDLQIANQDLESEKAGGMQWLWIVLGLLFAVVIFISIYKCYCQKEKEEGDKQD